MKHATVTGAWRPIRTRRDGQNGGWISAFAFNLLLLILPLACAASLIVIGRDQLYAYELSDAGSRAIAARVARLNGELIQVDFDRQRQWDDLIAMELRAGDVVAARGFLLSGGGMLPERSAALFNRPDASDGEIEAAALELLQPSTRARYETDIAAYRTALETQPRLTIEIGDAQDFELMARAILASPENDTLLFLLTGYSLGLVGELSPRVRAGAATLLLATRREDYPQALSAEVNALLAQSVPIERFRAAALDSADGESAGAYTNVAAAFRTAADAAATARVFATLDQLGAVSEASSPAAAAAMLTHAAALADVERLALLANAAGDRAVAAAKRLPRDGRLLEAARGHLTVTQDLIATLAVAAAAAAGLVLIVLFKLFEMARRAWLRMRPREDDDYAGELIDISSNNWRPL